MVLAHYVTNDTGALDERSVVHVIDFLHREKHSSMHRLEPVARIGQCATDDHAHGVVEETLAHFLFEANRYGFFGE